jgi:hypothetical protein
MRSDQEIYASNNERGYVGGGYFNPFSDFEANARPLASARLRDVLNHTVIGFSDSAAATFITASVFAEIAELLQQKD